MDPPWSLRIQDEAPLTLVAIVRGEAWVVPDVDEPTRLGQGDVAILRGPEPYTVADDPATAPQAVIHPDQRCTTPDGEESSQMQDLGVRTWGNSPDGATVMLCGTYQLHGEISQRLLRALPTLLVVAGDAWDSPLVPLLAAEIVKDEPGQEAVLDRLLDLLLIARPFGRGSRAPRRKPRPGIAPTAIRSSAPPCGCCTTPRSSSGPSPRWPTRAASRGRHWPGASQTSWASRR